MSSNDAIEAVPSDGMETLIGKVTIAYNRVQYAWLMLFKCYLMGDENLARAMFEALRNDASQRDIIIASATVSLRGDPKLLSRTKELMALTNRLSAERNVAVHTIWDTEVISGKSVPARNLKKHGKLEDDAITQFYRVTQELDDLFQDLLTLSSVTILSLASDERYLEPDIWHGARGSE